MGNYSDDLDFFETNLNDSKLWIMAIIRETTKPFALPNIISPKSERIMNYSTDRLCNDGRTDKASAPP